MRWPGVWCVGRGSAGDAHKQGTKLEEQNKFWVSVLVKSFISGRRRCLVVLWATWLFCWQSWAAQILSLLLFYNFLIYVDNFFSFTWASWLGVAVSTALNDTFTFVFIRLNVFCSSDTESNLLVPHPNMHLVVLPSLPCTTHSKPRKVLAVLNDTLLTNDGSCPVSMNTVQLFFLVCVWRISDARNRLVLIKTIAFNYSSVSRFVMMADLLQIASQLMSFLLGDTDILTPQ